MACLKFAAQTRQEPFLAANGITVRTWLQRGPDPSLELAVMTDYCRVAGADASIPRNCVLTVNSPIFLPMSFPTSVEKR